MVIKKAVTLLCLLVTSFIGFGLVNLIQANPYSAVDVPPIYDRPAISFVSPINGTAQKNQIIIFNLEMPETWKYTKSFSTGERYEFYVGTIRNVTCTLDNNIVMVNNTVYGRDANLPYESVKGHFPSSSNITYFQDVGVLSSGLHNITVLVRADTWSIIISSPSDAYSGYFDVSTTSTYSFVVSSTPTIAICVNATYEQSTVPLLVNIKETGLELEPCWIGYSIDNQSNQTISGNSTLTGLTKGTHSLVVYANDSFGNMGKSDTVFFNIAQQTPSSTISSDLNRTITPTTSKDTSLSPFQTLEPTLKPSTSAENMQTQDYTLLIALSGVALVAVAIGLIIYLKKRK